MKTVRSVPAAAGAAALCIAGLAVAPSSVAHPVRGESSHAVQVHVVATGLNSPKHLAFGPDHHLYVAETGTGDPTQTNCVPVTGNSGSPTQACVGKTGAISRIQGGAAVPVLTGLESSQQVDSGEAAGPAAFTWVGKRLLVVMQDSDVRPDGSTGLPGADEFGKLVLARPGSPRSSWVLFPDLAAFATENPQTGVGPNETANDSDPYDITPFRDGWAIADAAANDLLYLDRDTHELSVLARFPSVMQTAPAGVLGPNPVTMPAQFVPTSVVVGPDGALYVGGLRGVPSLPGTADVYRVEPGQPPAVYASGFSAITDIAFDRDGRLLVLEFSVGGLLSPPTTPGALIRVDGQQRTTLLSDGLHQPTGLAVGHGGDIYISNNGTSPGSANPSGEILRLTGWKINGH